MRSQAWLVAALSIFSLASSFPAVAGNNLLTRCPRCSRHLPLNPIAATHPVTGIKKRETKSLTTKTSTISSPTSPVWIDTITFLPTPMTARVIPSTPLGPVNLPTGTSSNDSTDPHSTNSSHSDDVAQCHAACFGAISIDDADMPDLEIDLICFEECQYQQAIRRRGKCQTFERSFFQ